MGSQRHRPPDDGLHGVHLDRPGAARVHDSDATYAAIARDETGLIVPLGRWVLDRACRSGTCAGWVSASRWTTSAPGTPTSPTCAVCRCPTSSSRARSSRGCGSAPTPSASRWFAGVIALAHTLDLTVTAEGIETTHQAQVLRELGCDWAQGHLLSRPGSADRVQNLAVWTERWLPGDVG